MKEADKVVTDANGAGVMSHARHLLVAERRSLTDVQTVSIIHQSRVTHPKAVEALREVVSGQQEAVEGLRCMATFLL